MQGDEAHAAVDVLLDAQRDLIGDAIVRHMRPPDQHVGVLEHFLGQAALGHFEGASAHLEVLLLAEQVLQRVVDAVGMNLLDGLRGLLEMLLNVLRQLLIVRDGFQTAFLNVLAPYGNLNHGYLPPSYFADFTRSMCLFYHI